MDLMVAIDVDGSSTFCTTLCTKDWILALGTASALSSICSDNMGITILLIHCSFAKRLAKVGNLVAVASVVSPLSAVQSCRCILDGPELSEVDDGEGVAD